MTRLRDPTRPWRSRRLHFVGIGGCGMSALALISQALGARVSGSDRADGRFLPGLRTQGIPVAAEHRAENLPADAELVYSTAIMSENPERAAAVSRGQPQVHRGELLVEICRLRRCIAIAGTHGKTTTAAMLVHALAAAGVSASYAVGAILLDSGLNADWTGSDLFIVETDESDGSHLAIESEIAILTNADHDHVKRYPDIDAVRATFRQFLDGVPQAVIWDRPELLALSSGPTRPFDATDVRADGSGTTFTWRGRAVRVRALGEHNARNAAAALEVCSLLGANLDSAVASLACFGGTSRRLELRGHTETGARIYDDYAHHPTAVEATLQALGVLGAQRLVAVLQPWGLPRVAALWREFASSLDRADEVVVLDTVVGGSKPEDFPDVGSELIVRAAQASRPGRPVHNIPRHEEAEGYLLDVLRAGDVCVTLGCGDVDQLATALVTGAPSNASPLLTA